jgi:glycosyltransferase involved in cell wall biosynthesis
MSALSPPALSLVVATFGRADVLEQLVRSLAAQTSRDFEVIVADQNADDRVRPFFAPLVASGRSVRHIRLEAPNLSAARNAGLAAATGDIVAFPDDDCWYEPDTIERVSRTFASNRALDGLAACWQEAASLKGEAAGPITSDAMRQFRGGNVASITLFLRRTVVLAAGGFDERIGVGRWYGSAEETDLVLSLLDKGACIERRGDIAVHHAVTAPKTRPWAQQFASERHRARGTGALYAKHRLPLWVVGRGLLAPLAAAPRNGLADSLAKTVGRLEGLVRWSLAEPRQAPNRFGSESKSTASETLQPPAIARKSPSQ